MDPDTDDRVRLENHSERLESMENQIANVIETNNALNETIKQLLERMDERDRESAPTAPTSPALTNESYIPANPLATGTPAVPPMGSSQESKNRINLRLQWSSREIGQKDVHSLIPASFTSCTPSVRE